MYPGASTYKLLSGAGSKNSARSDIEVFGDAEAVEIVWELIHSHGWRPVVRGGLEVAPNYEGGRSCPHVPQKISRNREPPNL